MTFLGDFPVFVYLFDDGDGGEFIFLRELRAGGHHRALQERRIPDRVDARQLFLRDFDLAEEFRYDISPEQLDELTADLSAGRAREFSLTTPDGNESTLTVGGTLVRPAGATFAACRKTSKSAREPKSR